MTIQHHLDDRLLMAYSAGTLPEAFSLVVASHVSMCDECRARLEGFDAVGGTLLDDCPVADMSDDAFEATLALIEGMGPAAPAPAPEPAGGIFPAPLRDYIGGDLSAVKWRSVGGGVRQSILVTKGGASARLIRIPAGVSVPDHGHKGTELTLVLQGAFRDDVDRFGRGDVEVADQHLEHTPIADDGEDCICLAATDAPLRFNAFIPRIAQPFLRI